MKSIGSSIYTICVYAFWLILTCNIVYYKIADHENPSTYKLLVFVLALHYITIDRIKDIINKQ